MKSYLKFHTLTTTTTTTTNNNNNESTAVLRHGRQRALLSLSQISLFVSSGDLSFVQLLVNFK